MANILVIDDDPLFRKLLNAALEAHGHLVEVANDGQHGLDLARANRPDLVVSDMNMPVMTGWEFLRALNDDAELSGIPVIVLSAHRTSQDYEEAHNQGVAAYVTKPVKIDDLAKKVDDVLAG